MNIEEMRAQLKAAEEAERIALNKTKQELLAGLVMEYGATEIAPMLYELWRQPTEESLAAAKANGLVPGDWDYRAKYVSMRHVLIESFLYPVGGGYVLTDVARGFNQLAGVRLYLRSPVDIGKEAADAIRRGEFPAEIRTAAER